MEIPNVDKVEHRGEEGDGCVKVAVLAKEDADIREALFYGLAEAKLPILAMSLAEKSLEDIFLELTDNVAPTEVTKRKLFKKKKTEAEEEDK